MSSHCTLAEAHDFVSQLLDAVSEKISGSEFSFSKESPSDNLKKKCEENIKHLNDEVLKKHQGTSKVPPRLGEQNVRISHVAGSDLVGDNVGECLSMAATPPDSVLPGVRNQEEMSAHLKHFTQPPPRQFSLSKLKAVAEEREQEGEKK